MAHCRPAVNRLSLLLAAMIVLVATGALASSFPDYPFAGLSLADKRSLAIWGVIGQTTSWCVCTTAGMAPSAESLATTGGGEDDVHTIGKALRNPNILRDCEKRVRSNARKRQPPSQMDVPEELSMAAWWYLIYYYTLDECHCKGEHTNPNYDPNTATQRCSQEAREVASSAVLRRRMEQPSAPAMAAAAGAPDDSATGPEKQPRVPYLPLPPPPPPEPESNGGGAGQHAPRFFSPSSLSVSPPLSFRSRSMTAGQRARFAQTDVGGAWRRAFAAPLDAGRGAVAAGVRELRDPERLRQRVGAFGDKLRKEMAAAAAAASQLRTWDAEPRRHQRQGASLGMGPGRAPKAPLLLGH